MVVQKETLKSYFIRDKFFLLNLFKGQNPHENRRLILSASEGEIDTLIKYLHCLANGKIKIGSQNFANIKRRRKLSILQKEFESDRTFSHLLKAQDLYKRSVLIKLAPAYQDVLTPLFVYSSQSIKK